MYSFIISLSILLLINVNRCISEIYADHLIYETNKLISTINAYGKKELSLIKLLKINNYCGEDNPIVCKVSYKNKNYILKQIPPYCANIQFLDAALLFRETLREMGIPIPKFIKTSDNKKYALEKLESGKDRIYILENFIDGISWKKKKEQVENMASMLAKIHKISHDIFFSKKQTTEISYDKKLELPKKNVFDIASHMLKISKEVLSTNSTWNSDKKNFLNSFINKCHVHLQKIKKSAMKKGYNTIMIPIHGDYNPTNILFDKENNIIGIIDFDDCCIDNPIHDIATALLCICYFPFEKKGKLFLDKYQYELSIRNAKLFFSHYFKNSHLNSEKIIPYIDEAFEAIAIQCLALYLIKGIYTEFSQVEDFFQHITLSKNLIKKAFEVYLREEKKLIICHPEG